MTYAPGTREHDENERLKAELDRYAEGHGIDRRAAWSPADLRQAHADVLAARLGLRAQDPTHPLAEALLEGGVPTLEDLARAAAVAQFGPQARSWDGVRLLMSGSPSSEHLGALLSGLAQRLLLERLPNLLRLPLAITRGVELKNFQPASVGTVELAEPIAPATTSEFVPWQTMVPSAKVEEMALRSSPVRLRFDQIALTNDDVSGFAGLIDAAATCAAQNELTALFTLLNSAVTLADGAPAFGTGNALTTTKNAAGLDAAEGLLRTQAINGKAADCAPRFLVVPAADASTARTLVRSAYGDTGAVEVLPTAYLSNYWFMLADPATWPVLLRGTLLGAGGVSLRLGPGRPNQHEGNADQIVEGLHSYDYAIGSRVGAVRMAF